MQKLLHTLMFAGTGIYLMLVFNSLLQLKPIEPTEIPTKPVASAAMAGWPIEEKFQQEYSETSPIDATLPTTNTQPVPETAETSDSDLTAANEDVIEVVYEELKENPALVHQSLRAIGFTQKAVDVISQNEPGTVLSINDLSPALRTVIQRQLFELKSNGYGKVSDFDADEITGVMNYLIGQTAGSANIIFTLSEIPDAILKNYEYMGYTHPNYSTNNEVVQAKNGTIRRVFSSLDSSSILILEESTNLPGSSAMLIKEFINSTVAGLPGIYEIKKSTSGKTYASLNWTTTGHAYNLYQVGDLMSSLDTLSSMGSALTELNYPDTAQ